MSRSSSQRINFQTLSKIFFTLYIVYTNVLSYSLFHITGLSAILLTVTVMLQLMYDHFRIHMDRSLVALLFFTFYALVSGFPIAQDYSRVLNSSLSFIEYLVSFYLIVAYIQSDRKPDFPMIVFIIQALTLVFFLVFRGAGITRISISDVVNVNTIGITLAFGIGFILYLLIAKENKPIKWMFGIAGIGVLLVGVMLTVSKKAIIAGVALIVLWIILCYRFTFAKLKNGWKLLIILVLMATGIVLYRWFTSKYAFQLEVFTYRMSNLYIGESDQMRIQLIKEGFSIFLSHPFFGVGLNNARFYSVYNTYTHCMYTEALACTGIIGTVIFGYAMVRPWIIIVRKRKAFKSYNMYLNTKTIYMLAIFIVFLISNLMQIAFYAQNHMYVLSVFTGYAVILHIMDGEKGEINAKSQNVS